MPADIILYAIIAVFLVFWLKSTLGTKDEDDRERPNPFTDLEQDKQGSTFFGLDDPLSPELHSEEQQYQKILTESVENKTAELGVEQIAKADKTFELGHFVEAAKDAFVMIVEGFAKGDKETLEMLLAPSVYKAFERVIDERIDKGQKVDTEIVAIRDLQIIEASLEGSIARMTLKIHAEETCIIRDANDEIIAGTPDQVTTMIDIWVLERDVKSDQPGWTLAETRDDHIEDHKTPIPEAS